jgi:hypothetical protein
VDDIRVIETHISWVILTGKFAYKIKKPVNLGFVDFTSLEKRRFCCHEELRLNRRLAPQLYLDVVAFAGSHDAPTLKAHSEPIEYAVKMKQFPQTALLSTMLEQGCLLAGHIDELAREVAEFHARIDVSGPESPFGSPEYVLRPVEENFRHMDVSASDILSSRRIQQLHEWSRREHADRIGDFTSRKQAGFVRECHGDMHLGNMVHFDGKITIFDCIEFNRSFRWIDVLSEVAFVVMDLEDRDRRDLAYRFLNEYLEITGDYEGLSVVRFYLVYRAIVRAKVAATRLRQVTSSSAKGQQFREEYESYLKLAERYTQPDRPMLIVTHGFSGSGKSTSTQPLLEAFGAVRIRSDVVRKQLFGLKRLERSNSAIDGHLYTNDATERTYRRLADCAAAVLRAGFPVIVDATFLIRNRRDSFLLLADKMDVPHIILDFQASEESLRRRLTSSHTAAGVVSEANVKVLQRQLDSHEPLTDEERRSTIAVDSRAKDAVALMIAAVQRRRSS